MEALQEDPSVVSIYSPKYVEKVKKAIDSLQSGNAIFTFPHTPIKCAGAAQKICYLTEEKTRQVSPSFVENIIKHFMCCCSLQINRRPLNATSIP